MRVLRVLSLMILLVMVAPSYAQTPPAPATPLVVFVEEPKTLAMASVTDNGPDGLTSLAAMFRSLGARTEWDRLTDPLPDDTSVVVLVRPRKPLTTDYLARIWQKVGEGASLLLALEPQGYLTTRTETPGQGIDKLVTLDEGISLRSGILIEPWFDNKSFENLFSTFSFGYAPPESNPVSDPLRTYDLPVALWGARPLRVEPLGANSLAWPLAQANPEYVETATNIFPARNSSGAPFQLNLDKDQLGQVNVAAIGENTVSGTHVAILGDAELVQNGYGLVLAADTQTPMYPADYIMTQRLAAWLLGLPIDKYPALPSGMTWIAIDGDISDWPDSAPITHDGTSDASILSLNIDQVRAVHNDSYLYMSVETISQPSLDAQVDLQFDTTGNGKADTLVSLRPDQVLAQHGTQAAAPVVDAAMAIGNVIELRVPLRLTGATPRIVSLCLSSARELAFPQPPDCMDTPIQIGRLNQVDPAPVRYTTDPVLAVEGDLHNRINVRSGPTTTSPVVATVPYGTIFEALGRTSGGSWVQVQTAAYVGWISRDTLFTPEALDALPVTG